MLWHMVSLKSVDWAISQSDMYSGLAGACFVSIIMISYMIPLYIKFGMEKSRIVSVSGMAAIFLILYLGIKISKERNGSILKIISRAEKLSDGIVILLIFAVFGYINLHFTSVRNESNEKARIIKRDRCEKQ